MIFAWWCKAKTMGCFTKEEFVKGCQDLIATSIDVLKEALQNAQEDLKNNVDDFKGMYEWAYNFTLEKGQKFLATPMVIALWRMVYFGRDPPIFERWLAYLGEKPPKAISRDTWILFGNFVDVIGTDLSVYDGNGEWPTLIYNFVEYEKDRLDANVLATAPEKFRNK